MIFHVFEVIVKFSLLLVMKIYFETFFYNKLFYSAYALLEMSYFFVCTAFREKKLSFTVSYFVLHLEIFCTSYLCSYR
jgi:hypothetical protein